MLDQVMALLKKEQVFFTQAKKIKDSIFNDSIKKKKITKDTKEKEFEKFDVSKKRRRSPKEFLKKKKASKKN